MNFSVTVKQIRKNLKMSQAQLASELKINVATISRWENGRNTPNSTVGNQLLTVAKKNCASEALIKELEKLLQNCITDGEISLLSRVPANVLNQMVNSSANAIYICDCENYDLLYINRTAADIINSTPKDAEGKKCYEYIMHRDSPCPFCSVKSRSMHHFDEVEFLYPFTNRRYLMRGKLLDWNGRTANIEYVSEDAVQQYRHTAIDNMMDYFSFFRGCFLSLSRRKA